MSKPPRSAAIQNSEFRILVRKKDSIHRKTLEKILVQQETKINILNRKTEIITTVTFSIKQSRNIFLQVC